MTNLIGVVGETVIPNEVEVFLKILLRLVGMLFDFPLDGSKIHGVLDDFRYRAIRY